MCLEFISLGMFLEVFSDNDMSCSPQNKGVRVGRIFVLMKANTSYNLKQSGCNITQSHGTGEKADSLWHIQKEQYPLLFLTNGKTYQPESFTGQHNFSTTMSCFFTYNFWYDMNI